MPQRIWVIGLGSQSGPADASFPGQSLRGCPAATKDGGTSGRPALWKAAPAIPAAFRRTPCPPNPDHASPDHASPTTFPRGVRRRIAEALARQCRGGAGTRPRAGLCGAGHHGERLLRQRIDDGAVVRCAAARTIRCVSAGRHGSGPWAARRDERGITGAVRVSENTSAE